MTLPTFPGSTAGVRLLVLGIFAPVIAGLLPDLICRLTPRASAAARHLVWLLAFVAMAVCPLITLLNKRVPLPILPAPPASQASAIMPSVLSAAAAESGEPRGDLQTTAHPAPPAQSVGLMVPAPKSTTSPGRQIRWKFLVPGLWALGFLWQSFISLAGTWRLQGVIKRSRFCEDSRLLALWTELCPPDACRPVGGLLFSSEVKVPFVAFWRCPFVILPEAAREWPSPMLHTAFVHELAHIERGDLWWSAFARWVASLYWFNPMAWYGLRRLQAEAEMAADDRVVTAGSSPVDYAENLVLLVRTHRPGASSLFPAIGMARPRGIEARVARILDPSSRRLAPKPFVRLAALSGAVLITTGALMIRLVAAPPPAQADSTATAVTNKPPASADSAAPAPSVRIVQVLTKAGAAPPKAALGEPASGAATEAGKASAGAGSPEVQRRFAGIWTGTFFRSGSGNTDNVTIVINATETSATASNFFPSPQTGSTSITGNTISWKWLLASWKMTVSQDGQTAQIDCDSPFEVCRGTLVKKFDH